MVTGNLCGFVRVNELRAAALFGFAPPHRTFPYDSVVAEPAALHPLLLDTHTSCIERKPV